MTLRDVIRRCFAPAFCLGVLEGVLLVRLQYVTPYRFLHLEILNLAVLYAVVIGVGLWIAAWIAERIRLGSAFVGAAGLCLIPLFLTFRYRRYLLAQDDPGALAGSANRLVALAVIVVAALALGWLFRRWTKVEKGVSWAVWGVTAVIFLGNVIAPVGGGRARLVGLDEAAYPANVVWVTSDALRADHLSSYGYDRETSPTLETFRQDALFFANSYSQSCWTLPSMVSLFTSLYPYEASPREGALSPDVHTVAEILRAAGYRTVGLSNNEVVGPSTSLDRGFDVFFRPPRLHARDRLFAYASLFYLLDDVLSADAVYAWVEAVMLAPQRQSELPARTEQDLFATGMAELAEAEEPFFLYLHFMAPHAPYAPEGAWQDWGGGHDLAPTEHLLHDARVMPPKDLPAAEVAEIVWRYDREIRMVDALFGEVLERLRERGLYEDCLVIFASDHGEEFLEHGEWTHPRGLYQESVHVPLLIKLPGNALGGRTVTDPVQGIDVLPTILEVLGLDPELEYAVRGEPLVLDGGGRLNERAGLRPVILEFDSPNPAIGDQTALIAGDHKLIHRRAEGRYELYDLATDPQERHDLAETEPQILSDLSGALQGLEEAHRAAAHATVANPAAAKRLEEELRALGYVD